MYAAASLFARKGAMDSTLNAAALALAGGDVLGALNRVALRDDPASLALRGIAMAQLGDLARATEAELLASKNFGETSLVEIKDMMASKGLSLGMFGGEVREPEPVFEPEFVTPDEQAILDRPIAELNLSVRARKCMIRLGLNTIGELLRKTGDDLLECKNFGVTSLNEVREKLTLKGLKLRGD